MQRRDMILGSLAALLGAHGRALAKAKGPAVWKAQSRTATVYVFGDGPPRRTPVRFASIDAIAAKCAVVWREVPPVPPGQAQKFVRDHGFDPATPLTRRVPAAIAEALPGAAEAAGLPLATLQVLRPWAATLLLQSGYYPRVGLNNALNDAGVTAAAEAAGKPIRYEMADSQGVLSYAAGMSPAAQIEFLGWVIADIRTPLATWADRARAWDEGDLNSIEAWIGTMRNDYPHLYAEHVVGRNAAWTPRIREMLAGRETVLVVVGAGHLVGPDSMQRQLAAAGIRLTRV